MRVGLRLQILAAIAVLLVLAFVPLWRAVAQVTERALVAQADAHAQEIAALFAEIGEREGRLPNVGDDYAACLYSTSNTNEGVLIACSGGVETKSLHSARGYRFAGASPIHATREHVTVLLWPRARTSRAESVMELARLYTALFAVALLAFAFAALTWLVVRPVEALALAAQRVQRDPDAEFTAPTMHAAELDTLASHLRTMTAVLHAKEQQLQERLKELSKTTAHLTTARHELAEGERLASVGRLAAGVAHEIGNPLTAIFGLADLLAEGGLDEPEVRDFAGRIRKESERAHGTIRDLLDFARAKPEQDAGGNTSLTQVIEHVTGLLRPQKGFRSIDVHTDIAADLHVRMNEARLTQVLVNLALNAQDAIASGNPGGAGTLRFTASAEDTRVIVRVEDDGPGVNAEVRERLFEPFVTTKDPGRGTGLGLAVCRSLVEAAGGTLRLEDSPRGATFRLDLPRMGASSRINQG